MININKIKYFKNYPREVPKLCIIYDDDEHSIMFFHGIGYIERFGLRYTPFIEVTDIDIYDDEPDTIALEMWNEWVTSPEYTNLLNLDFFKKLVQKIIDELQ